MHLLVLFGKYENINDVTKSISFIDLSLFGSVVAVAVVVAFQSVFSCRNASKWYFFLFFKKLFLKSAHQNDPKYKKINF